MVELSVRTENLEDLIEFVQHHLIEKLREGYTSGYEGGKLWWDLKKEGDRIMKFTEVEKMENGAILTFKRHLTEGEVGPDDDHIPYGLSMGGKGFYVMLDGKTYLMTWKDFVEGAYLQLRKDHPR